jgi:hypothetical protein
VGVDAGVPERDPLIHQKAALRFLVGPLDFSAAYQKFVKPGSVRPRSLLQALWTFGAGVPCQAIRAVRLLFAAKSPPGPKPHFVGIEVYEHAVQEITRLWPASLAPKGDSLARVLHARHYGYRRTFFDRVGRLPGDTYLSAQLADFRSQTQTLAGVMAGKVAIPAGPVCEVERVVRLWRALPPPSARPADMFQDFEVFTLFSFRSDTHDPIGSANKYFRSHLRAALCPVADRPAGVEARQTWCRVRLQEGGDHPLVALPAATCPEAVRAPGTNEGFWSDALVTEADRVSSSANTFLVALDTIVRMDWRDQPTLWAPWPKGAFAKGATMILLVDETAARPLTSQERGTRLDEGRVAQALTSFPTFKGSASGWVFNESRPGGIESIKVERMRAPASPLDGTESHE